MSDVFLDADIVIWHLRGLPHAQALLHRVGSDANSRLCMSAIQWAEVTVHLRPTEQELATSLEQVFSIMPVTKEVVDRAAVLFRRWNPSRGTDVNDAILAATVIRAGGKLYTQNIRHFPMPELDVELGWE